MSCILKIVKFTNKREKTFDILTHILPGDFIRGRDSTVVGFITTYAISAHHN